MNEMTLCIVGPAGRDTGGVARYIAEHERMLPARIRARVYDVATPEGAGMALSMLHAGLRAVRFPFQRRPDVVHVHTSHYNSFYLSAFYILVASLLWRRPVVCHVHGSSFDEFVETDSLPLAAFQSIVFALTDNVIVLSEYWEDALAPRVDEQKLEIVPNAIEPDRYDPRFAVDPPHVVFVSNHVQRKGITEFTTAISELLDAGYEFEVTIAGSGPLSHRAEALAANADEVSYLGYVSEAEKRDLLSRASVYVLPTYAEGLPIALLEGMAGGNALVSTRLGSIPDVIDEENGELVPPGGVPALRDAIERLVRSPARVEDMARRNREMVKSGYSWESASERLSAIYEALCDRRRTSA
jgi:glycosyltransferase involved in cell wall biosynthesis